MPFTHESLLSDCKEQKLTSHEKLLAEESYEREKKTGSRMPDKSSRFSSFSETLLKSKSFSTDLPTPSLCSLSSEPELVSHPETIFGYSQESLSTADEFFGNSSSFMQDSPLPFSDIRSEMNDVNAGATHLQSSREFGFSDLGRPHLDNARDNLANRFDLYHQRYNTHEPLDLSSVKCQRHDTQSCLNSFTPPSYETFHSGANRNIFDSSYLRQPQLSSSVR